jgi:purine-binding chemotaxis protein CheW
MKALHEHLIFCLDHHRFAIPITELLEVTLATAITPVSGRLSLIEGVLTYRGKLIPLLNIRARLNLESRSLDAEQCFLVLRSGDKILAVRVDSVVDTVSISSQDLASGVPIPASSSAPLMIKLAGEVLAICDLQGLLSDEAEAQYVQLNEELK